MSPSDRRAGDKPRPYSAAYHAELDMPPRQAGAALGASRGRGQAPLQRRVSCGTRYAPNQVGAALVAACGDKPCPYSAAYHAEPDIPNW